MGIVLLLYILFLAAMTLPQFGFWSKALPALAINMASWWTVGIIGGALLLLWLSAREQRDVVLAHIRRLERILVVMMVGGLVDTLRYLIFYEQFRLRFNISSALYYVLIALWAAVFVMIVRGIYDLAMHGWRRSGKSSSAR